MRNFFKRHHVFAACLGFVIVTTASAFAAWVVTTGLSGTGGGNIGAPSTVGALTFTPASGASTPLIPGGTSPAYFNISSAASVPVTVATITAGAITETPGGATCASHLSYSPTAGTSIVGLVTQPTGWTGQSGGLFTADATLPTSCANGTVTVALTGTTTP